jgi:hypothetical protein
MLPRLRTGELTFVTRDTGHPKVARAPGFKV